MRTQGFWTDERAAEIRSMARYWDEVRQRDGGSSLQGEVSAVSGMVNHQGGLLRLAEFAADPVRIAAPDLLTACEANMAWNWAEASGSSCTATHSDRMELCNYSQWLGQRALALVAGEDPDAVYVGVPHMIVWPTVHLARAEQEEAQAIVDRVIDEWRSAVGGQVPA